MCDNRNQDPTGRVPHLLLVIRDKAVNDRITEIFKGIPALYVADGHHRTAAAARVGQECASKNPNHTGDEEYCFFLAVTFPASHLRIIASTRSVTASVFTQSEPH